MGTGAINIDDCKIEINKDNETDNRVGTDIKMKLKNSNKFFSGLNNIEKQVYKNKRFPSNVILDEESGKILDEQSGILTSGSLKSSYKITKNVDELGNYKSPNNIYGKRRIYDCKETDASSGGASRFFYCAKASQSERNLGLKHSTNNHPTVKPLSLMRYLCRLITPPDGIVLDPFMGSGTTGLACKLENFNFVGIEMNQEYFDTADKRINNYKIEYEDEIVNKSNQKLKSKELF